MIETYEQYKTRERFDNYTLTLLENEIFLIKMALCRYKAEGLKELNILKKDLDYWQKNSKIDGRLKESIKDDFECLKEAYEGIQEIDNLILKIQKL